MIERRVFGCFSIHLVLLLAAVARVSGIEYDVVVLGGTPGGISTAVTAARLGHSAVIAEYHAHLGGMTASGLGKSDITVAGAIGGLWDEFVARVLAHYTAEYGANSQQVADCRQGYYYEPSVAETVFRGMIDEAVNVDLLLKQELFEVVRRGRRVTAIRLRNRDDATIHELRGKVFIDATYEGDLAACAGAPCRVGRESRVEFDEPHAGVIYMDHKTRALLPGTTGAGDNRLVAYTYRLCLSSDPTNRLLPAMPPDYDRSKYLNYLLDLERGRIASTVMALSIAKLPNHKHDANMKPWPLGFPFAEENAGYVDADWNDRQVIINRIRNLTLGLLYFLQNDPAVPEAHRSEARQYGLAKDEFTDNGNFPFQLYVREARRIVGEYTLSERDLTLAPDSHRAPVHLDAVSAGEFPIDSFPTRKYEPGHEDALEGYILMLDRYTRPYQIPYRVMVPADVDGLLAPVPVSATHVAFSSVRLEPTWISLGQASGVAAHLAIRHQIEPRKVPIEPLQQMLLDQGQVLTYFEDVPKGSRYFKALNYLGTKGLFDEYRARPDEPADPATCRRWAQRLIELAGGDNGTPLALPAGAGLSRADLVHLLRDILRAIGRSPAIAHQLANFVTEESARVSRGQVCEALYRLLMSDLP